MPYSSVFILGGYCLLTNYIFYHFKIIICIKDSCISIQNTCDKYGKSHWYTIQNSLILNPYCEGNETVHNILSALQTVQRLGYCDMEEGSDGTDRSAPCGRHSLISRGEARAANRRLPYPAIARKRVQYANTRHGIITDCTFCWIQMADVVCLGLSMVLCRSS